MRTPLSAYSALALFLGTGFATDDAGQDAELIQGTWKVVFLQEGGKKEPPPPPAAFEQLGMRIIITKDKYTVKLKDLTDAKIYEIDPAKKPRWFDLAGVVAPGGNRIGPNLGIYELKGDDLKICFGKSGQGRPTKFDPNEDPAVDVSLVLKRERTAAVGQERMSGRSKL